MRPRVQIPGPRPNRSGPRSSLAGWARLGRSRHDERPRKIDAGRLLTAQRDADEPVRSGTQRSLGIFVVPSICAP